jgi:hypothetical protein
MKDRMSFFWGCIACEEGAMLVTPDDWGEVAAGSAVDAITLGVADNPKLSFTHRMMRSCSAWSLPLRMALISSAAMKSDFVVIMNVKKDRCSLFNKGNVGGRSVEQEWSW